MSEADDLRRAQAFNATLVLYIHSLTETTKRIGAPDAATLIRACEHMLREAALAALVPDDAVTAWRRRCALWRAGLGPDPGPPPAPHDRSRYECPKCGAVSYNPRDAIERYCVRCHEFAEP